MLNSKELKEKLTKYATEKGWGTQENALEEILTSSKKVFEELSSSHRWWDIWTHVVEFEGVLVGFDYARANRDMSVQDLGWEFDWELWECEKKEVVKTIYVPKTESA